MENTLQELLRCPYDGTKINEKLRCEKGHEFSENQYFINLLLQPIKLTGLDILNPIYEELWAPIGFYITSHNTYYSVLKEVENYVSGEIVADLGTGSGKIFDFMKCKVCIGLDRSENYLKRLKTKRPHVIGIRADLSEKIPLEDSSVDGTSMTFFLHMLSDKEKVLKEVYRITKPKGRVGAVVLANNNLISRILGSVWKLDIKTTPEYVELFKRAGFYVEDARVMGAWSLIKARKME